MKISKSYFFILRFCLLQIVLFYSLLKIDIQTSINEGQVHLIRIGSFNTLLSIAITEDRCFFEVYYGALIVFLILAVLISSLYYLITKNEKESSVTFWETFFRFFLYMGLIACMASINIRSNFHNLNYPYGFPIPSSSWSLIIKSHVRRISYFGMFFIFSANLIINVLFYIFGIKIIDKLSEVLFGRINSKGVMEKNKQPNSSQHPQITAPASDRKRSDDIQ